MPPKRKAVDDPYAHWVPTVPAPSTSGYTSSQSYRTGSYSNPVVADSPPKAKRVRKTKDPAAPAPEKRGAIFKKSCPKAILDRAERVASQRYAQPARYRYED